MKYIDDILSETDILHNNSTSWKALIRIIFSLFASSPPVIDTTAQAVNQVWSYLGELVFNMLVLVGTVRMADNVVKDMFGV